MERRFGALLNFSDELSSIIIDNYVFIKIFLIF